MYYYAQRVELKLCLGGNCALENRSIIIIIIIVTIIFIIFIIIILLLLSLLLLLLLLLLILLLSYANPLKYTVLSHNVV